MVGPSLQLSRNLARGPILLRPSRIRLTALLPEILDNIVSHLGKNDVLNLSLTCRTLRPLAEVALYKSVRVAGATGRATFLRGIQAQPHRVELIEDLAIQVTDFSKPNEWATHIAIVEILPQLINLRTFRVATRHRTYDVERCEVMAFPLINLPLENCYFHLCNKAGNGWSANQMPSIWSLIYLPTMKTVTMQHFNSKAAFALPKPGNHSSRGLTPYDFQPLDRLSFQRCDIDPGPLGNFLAIRPTRAVELFEHIESDGTHQFRRNRFWSIDRYVVALMRTRDYLESFYIYRSREKPPSSLDLSGLYRLKHLGIASHIYFCNKDHNYVRWNHEMIKVPLSIQVLDFACEKVRLKNNFEFALRVLVDRKESLAPQLREIHISTTRSESLVRDCLELVKFAARRGVEIIEHK